MGETPDWVTLQKALSVEAERGFSDLRGNRYRFSEFLCLSFGKRPVGMSAEKRRRWQELSADFARYPQLSITQRQHVVAEARRLIQELQNPPQVETPQPKTPRTTPVATTKKSCKIIKTN